MQNNIAGLTDKVRKYVPENLNVVTGMMGFVSQTYEMSVTLTLQSLVHGCANDNEILEFLRWKYMDGQSDCIWDREMMNRIKFARSIIR